MHVASACFGTTAVAFACAVLLADVVAAQAPAPRPAYRLHRFDEDWSALRDPSRRTNTWDRLKYISLGGGAFVSLGGDVRLSYERVDYPLFGRERPDHDGYLLQRYALHADLHPMRSVRLFGQLAAGFEDGRASGPRPTDVNKLELFQAFAEGRMGVGPRTQIAVRAGRQEMSLGSTRWINVRDGPNVRRTFDAVRALVRATGFAADAWVSRPVRTLPGAFDDSGDPTRAFAGGYIAVPISSLGGGVDAYGFRLRRDAARFAQGTARATRYTAGVRLWSRRDGWDYDADVATQWGDFGGSAIRGFLFAQDMGWTITQSRLRPRLGLRVASSSGDRDPRDPALQSLDPHFPSAFVFTAPVGPVNLTNVHPTLELRLHPTLTLFTDADIFWRTRSTDGVYDPAGNLFAPALSTSTRYLGWQPLLQVRATPSQHVRLSVLVARFFVGEGLRQVVDGRDITLLQVNTTYQF